VHRMLWPLIEKSNQHSDHISLFSTHFLILLNLFLSPHDQQWILDEEGQRREREVEG
jgi:hypothetical protein